MRRLHHGRVTRWGQKHGALSCRREGRQREDQDHEPLKLSHDKSIPQWRGP